MQAWNVWLHCSGSTYGSWLRGDPKKESARALSREGLCALGGVWARGCGVKPIKDQRHYENVGRYIVDHFNEGAAVWCERTGFIDPV